MGSLRDDVAYTGLGKQAEQIEVSDRRCKSVPRNHVRESWTCDRVGGCVSEDFGNQPDLPAVCDHVMGPMLMTTHEELEPHLIK